MKTPNHDVPEVIQKEFSITHAEWRPSDPPGEQMGLLTSTVQFTRTISEAGDWKRIARTVTVRYSELECFRIPSLQLEELIDLLQKTRETMAFFEGHEAEPFDIHEIDFFVSPQEG